MIIRKASLEKGFVQVYTGDGKGKTTASLGLAFRAAGHGLSVYVMQFMKGQTIYGELEAAKRLAPNLTIEQVGHEKFVRKGQQREIDYEMAESAYARAKEIVSSGDYDLVVLDEINCAVDFGLVLLEDLKELIRSKPPRTELVLTGRNAHPEIIEMADLVTEMREIKHYFNAGEPARPGIES